MIGAYLRLWHIDSLLHYYTEYDEGTLSLQARFIAEGFLPYQDFTLVHPPFYYLVLAALYKVFGYSLFYAKYLAVFLSLASIILIYLTGKKLHHTGAALVVASLFAVSPDMVYIGRRVVQEPLGIFLIILAIYFFAHFITNQRKKALIISGLALGLALATKYLFLPAVLAVFLALIIYLMGEKFWDRLKRLARPSFLFTYVLLTAVVFLIVFFICWAFNLPISVPLLDHGDFSTGSIILACGICILALFLTVLIMEKQICFREWWRRLGKVILRREVWYLAFGILFAFAAITGYFWIRVPQEFFYQTIILQSNRSAEFPSLITIFKGALGSWGYLKIAYITGLLSLPVALVMLNRNNVSRVDYFIAIATIIAVVFCQFLGGGAPRYYYSVYPLFLLGLASFVPGDTGLISANIKTLSTDIKIKLLGIMAVMVIFLSTSIAVIVDDPGYDVGITRLTSDEQYVYEKAIDYLESVSPNKVYVSNPIIIALSSQLNDNLDIDTFALLGLKAEPAEQFIQDNIDQGVDYFVLDYWVRRIFKGEIYIPLKQAISRHARLVQRIGTGNIGYIEIYELVPDGVLILNGDFSKWAKGEYTTVPHAWQSIVLGGEEGSGDNVIIAEDYKDSKQCIRLGVEEDDSSDGIYDSTFCRIYQSIPFPANRLVIDIMPAFNANTNNEKNVPKHGIVFISSEFTLTISFSDAVDTEQFVISADGHSATVIRPAELGQWSEETIALASYWTQAGREPPDEVDISFFVSTHYTSPGTYNLYIADVAEE
ncbi:ArnT family glycosyltransferase [Chloroflexota bacterium]